jgi:muconate cycloisomerase
MTGAVDLPAQGLCVDPVVVYRFSVFPLSIPLRRTRIASSCPTEAVRPVVVAVELTNGTVGYGETLPEAEVTGETVETVVDAVKNVFVPFLTEFHPPSFPAALEAIESLPWRDAGDGLIPAARAAVELALLDATMRRFRRDIDAVVQWMGLPGFGSPGSLRDVRYSGVLAADGLGATLRTVRRMYWRGLRHFKLEVGFPGDRQRVERVAGYLRRAIAKGRADLRVDVCGRWSKDQAIDWLKDAAHLPIAAVEQPLPKGAEEDLPVLADLFDVPLMHDESLVTIDDGHRLIELGVADGFNIRISKCGGLLPSLRLAALARRGNTRVQLGFAPGETSILSAAGLRFLEVCPTVTWAEGCLGRLLLKRDVLAKGLRLRYGGRPPQLKDRGLGVEVDGDRLASLCDRRPVVLNL